MRAVVKVAYFDNSGLHKAGEIVEVKKLNPYLKAIEDKAESQVEEQTETPAEVTTKKETKKTTKRTKKG